MVEGNGGDGDQIVRNAMFLEVLWCAVFQITQVFVLEQYDEGKFRGAFGVGIVERDCVFAVFALPDVKEGGIIEQPINTDGLRLTRVAFCGLIACDSLVF